MLKKNLFLIALIVASYCGYKFYLYRECAYCAEDLYKKEDLFSKGKHFEALFGSDEDSQGFIDLVGKYLSPGNNAKVMLYVGLCYKNIDYYEAALKYLLTVQKYIYDEIMLYHLLGCIGDIYVQLEKYSYAEEYYNKAINCGYYCDSDKLLYLFKLIYLYEYLELYSKAYNLIDDFISKHKQAQKYKELVDEKKKLEIVMNVVQSRNIINDSKTDDGNTVDNIDTNINTNASSDSIEKDVVEKNNDIKV